MKWLARGGLALGLLYLAIFALGSILGIIPTPLQDLTLIDADMVARAEPMASIETPPGRRSYLRVTVASGQNLISKSIDGELNIYPMVTDCDDPDVGLFAYGPYFRGLHVSTLSLDSDNPRFEPLGNTRANRYDYQLYIPIAGRLRSESDFNRSMPAYDLRRDNRVLCIRVGGGNMAMGHFRSNVIRLRMPRAPE